MTTVRWIRSAEELERSATTLRAVAARAERPLPAADPDFLRSYIEHFEYSSTPLLPEIVVVERRGEVVGYLATRSSHHQVGPRLSVRERTLLVTHDHDRVNLVCGAVDEVEVAEAVAEELLHRGNAGALDIAGLQVGSPLHRALHARAAASHLWTSYDVDLPAFCSVPVRWDTTAGYFRALSKTMRSNVSRQTRRLFAAGTVELLRADGTEETGPLLPAYLDMEQRSWKYAANAGILRSPRRTAFFGDVVSGRAAYTPSMVGVVLDGVLVAALLLGRYGTGMWALEMAFDDAHRDLGAGQVLLVLAMEEAIAAGARSLGYLQHFAYFKKRWLAEETEVVSTRVVRRASPVHLRHLVGEAERRLRGPHQAKLSTVGGQDQAVLDTEPTTESTSNEVTTRTISGRPARLPDAVKASRQLLLHGSRSGVLLGRERAERLLPFPLR